MQIAVNMEGRTLQSASGKQCLRFPLLSRPEDHLVHSAHAEATLGRSTPLSRRCQGRRDVAFIHLALSWPLGK